MSNPLCYFEGSLNPLLLFRAIKFKKQFRQEHPEYFDPDGIMVFCGPQGSGKTLSAVQYVLRLIKAYPHSILVTNVEIQGLPEDYQVYQYTGLRDLSTYSNGYAGVIYLIDEIQIEFNSLESKNIDPSVITEIAQQRKQRKHIVGTSQVFGRIAKPFREQFKYAMLCRCFAGVLQYNVLIDGAKSIEDADGHIQCDSIKRYMWLHDPELYKSYNTYAKILRTKERGYKNGYGSRN